MNLGLDSLNTAEIVIIALLGLVLLLLGYRFKKVAFFLIWFVLGFYLTSTALAQPQVSHLLPEAILNWSMYQSLLPVAGGLLLALLGFSIEKLCVAGICFALVILVAVQYFGSDIQVIAIGGIIGVVVAGVATMSMKPATIIATAVAGAYTLTMALLALIPGINQQIAYFPSLLGLSILGSVVQFMTTKNF